MAKQNLSKRSMDPHIAQGDGLDFKRPYLANPELNRIFIEAAEYVAGNLPSRNDISAQSILDGVQAKIAEGDFPPWLAKQDFTRIANDLGEMSFIAIPFGNLVLTGSPNSAVQTQPIAATPIPISAAYQTAISISLISTASIASPEKIPPKKKVTPESAAESQLPPRIIKLPERQPKPKITPVRGEPIAIWQLCELEVSLRLAYGCLCAREKPVTLNNIKRQLATAEQLKNHRWWLIRIPDELIEDALGRIKEHKILSHTKADGTPFVLLPKTAHLMTSQANASTAQPAPSRQPPSAGRVEP